MATVSAKVFEHHLKADGTFNVKICVYHKKNRKYMDTIHYVSKRQLNSDFKIKDKFMIKLIDDVLDAYRESISQLGPKLNFFSCEGLLHYLQDKDQDIDFIKFLL